MPEYRLRFFLILLLGLITACGESTQSVLPDDTSNPLSTTSLKESAQSRMAVNISFNGDTAQFSDQAKVYVFLRQSGTRMPLVVEQFYVSDLPKRVVFAQDLQQANIELVTRLSPSGKVNKSTNDIEVITQVGQPGHSPLIFNVSLGREAENAYQYTANSTSIPVVLHLRVSVSSKAEIPHDADLRIIVKGDDNPSPIAIKSLGVNELPVDLTFTDLDALGLKQTLSSSKKLTISALIYQTGAETPPDSILNSESIDVETANVPELVLLEIGK